jgi:hypothetical protein
MDTMLTITGAPVVVDFNPMADRLRFMTGTTNHRVHLDTGAVTVDDVLTFEDGDMQAKRNAQYRCGGLHQLYRQAGRDRDVQYRRPYRRVDPRAKPNNGALKAIGKLGTGETPATYAFDIRGEEDGKNAAYLVANKTLYTVNLETGAATEVGIVTGVENDVRDIDIFPAM